MATGTNQLSRRRARPLRAARAALPAPAPRPPRPRGGGRGFSQSWATRSANRGRRGHTPGPREEARTPGSWLPGAYLSALGSRWMLLQAPPTVTRVWRGTRTHRHSCFPARCPPVIPPPVIGESDAALWAGRSLRSSLDGALGLGGFMFLERFAPNYQHTPSAGGFRAPWALGSLEAEGIKVCTGCFGPGAAVHHPSTLAAPDRSCIPPRSSCLPGPIRSGHSPVGAYHVMALALFSLVPRLLASATHG